MSTCTTPDNTDVKSYCDDVVIMNATAKSILKPGGPLCRRCGRYVGGEIVTMMNGHRYCTNCWE